MTTTADAAIHALRSLGEMRVWSLVITIFGDAALPRGGHLPASAVQAVLEQAGIRPEAVRVALHRLVKDGWVRREKAGRQSVYHLAPGGEAEFQNAQQRIYARAPALKDPWRLIVTQGTEQPNGFIRITDGVFLADVTRPVPDNALALTGSIDTLPDWAIEALAPEPLPSDYVRLEDALKTVSRASQISPAQAAVLRILLVHHWRRLLLRHPDLPAVFFPEGWRGEACRHLALDLHQALSESADPWFDAVIGPS